MTRYESYFMMTFILSGFIVTAGSLLPLLLALYGLLQPTIWRVSGIIMAIPIFVFVVTLPGRRRAASQKAIPNAIIRPTLVFGIDDILLNNIAWLLRRAPLFAIPGSGDYRLQPICVEDVAEIAVRAVSQKESITIDAQTPSLQPTSAAKEAEGSGVREIGCQRDRAEHWGFQGDLNRLSHGPGDRVRPKNWAGLRKSKESGAKNGNPG